MPDWGNEEFVTVAEVAALLKLNQQTIRNWIDQGSLPALRIGRRVRVLRSDLDALVERGYHPAAAPAPSDTARSEAFWDGVHAGPRQASSAAG